MEDQNLSSKLKVYVKERMNLEFQIFSLIKKYLKTNENFIIPSIC